MVTLLRIYSKTALNQHGDHGSDLPAHLVCVRLAEENEQ